MIFQFATMRKDGIDPNSKNVSVENSTEMRETRNIREIIIRVSIYSYIKNQAIGRMLSFRKAFCATFVFIIVPEFQPVEISRMLASLIHYFNVLKVDNKSRLKINIFAIFLCLYFLYNLSVFHVLNQKSFKSLTTFYRTAHQSKSNINFQLINKIFIRLQLNR